MIDSVESEFVGRNYSIINSHAPTEDKDDEEKYVYLELETGYSQWPKHDIKMVLGDFNAKVGKKIITPPPLQEEMDWMRNVTEMGINWYSLPPQRI
jgi:hypothetical protein